MTGLTPSILRVRMAREGKWPEDASWAVPAEVRAQSVKVTMRAGGFETEAVTVRFVLPDSGKPASVTPSR